MGDLERLPWALPEGQGHFRQFLENTARRHDVILNCAVECSSYAQVAMAIQTGKYAGFLPEFAGKAAFGTEGSIVQRPGGRTLRYERSLTLTWSEATFRARPVLAQVTAELGTAISARLK